MSTTNEVSDGDVFNYMGKTYYLDRSAAEVINTLLDGAEFLPTNTVSLYAFVVLPLTTELRDAINRQFPLLNINY